MTLRQEFFRWLREALVDLALYLVIVFLALVLALMWTLR